MSEESLKSVSMSISGVSKLSKPDTSSTELSKHSSNPPASNLSRILILLPSNKVFMF